MRIGEGCIMARTVVIVDDSKFIIDQLANHFKTKLNYNVVGTGYDGNDEVLLFRKHKPDLLTLDICMPIKDGKQAIQEVREDFPDARILVVSAIRGNSMLECMDLCAGGYIEKPLKLNDPDFVQEFEFTLNEIFEDNPA
jgi:two-component system chemotaxis response regulator CheY